MEPSWRTQRAALPLLFLCSALVTRPSSAIDIRADQEVLAENGTTGVLRCSFKSNQVVSSATSVSWSFQSSEPESKFSKDSYSILFYIGGKAFPGLEEFKERIQFVGDINKRDMSIQLSPVLFSDNGTYFCDVKNPPDVDGTRARTELRVVFKGRAVEILSQTDGLKETSSGEPSTIHPDAPHGSGSAPSER